MDVKAMSDEKLKEEAIGLFGSIFELECYSTGDIVLYEMVCRELESRGYTVEGHSTLSIEKEGED